MPPTNAGRFADVAAAADVVEKTIPTPSCEKATHVLDEDAGAHDLATDRWSPRPVSPTRVALSQNAHPRSYNDPSNYLG
jgi:hypothetical protein